MAKPTLHSKFSINGSLARSFAETRWGRGGTNTHRTTAKGMYYFSCSGHGGYVVDSKNLRPDTIAILDEIGIKPTDVGGVLGTDDNGDTYVIGYFNPFSYRSKGITVPYRFVGRAKKVDSIAKVYLFEEDCDFALLEVIEGVRLKDVEYKVTAEEYDSHIAKHALKYYPKLTLAMANQL